MIPQTSLTKGQTSLANGQTSLSSKWPIRAGTPQPPFGFAFLAVDGKYLAVDEKYLMTEF